MSKKPAVFLDRDGVLVIPEFREGRSFAPTRLADFEIYPTAATSLSSMRDAGYVLVVVTNQPDVGKGIIPVEVINAMHERLNNALPIDRIEVCTHTSEDKCDCRKPAWGMLHRASEELGIALDQSFMIGDRKSDIEAGKAAGCKTIFIDHGYVSEQRPNNPDWTICSIEQAVPCILNSNSKNERPLNDTC